VRKTHSAVTHATILEREKSTVHSRYFRQNIQQLVAIMRMNVWQTSWLHANLASHESSPDKLDSAFTKSFLLKPAEYYF
jgi:hypothetical protein